MKYCIDNKNMISDISVLTGTNVSGADVAIDNLILVILHKPVKNASDLDNIENSSVVVKITFFTFFLV